MEVKVRSVVVFAVAAIAFLAAMYAIFRPTEESRIIAAFSRASNVISKSEGESILTTAAKTSAIADLADAKIKVSVPEQGFNATIAPPEAARHATAVRASCVSISVRFDNVRVQSIEGDVAHATAKMVVSGSGIESYLSTHQTRLIDAYLKKSAADGKWRFSAVSVDVVP